MITSTLEMTVNFKRSKCCTLKCILNKDFKKVLILDLVLDNLCSRCGGNECSNGVNKNQECESRFWSYVFSPVHAFICRSLDQVQIGSVGLTRFPNSQLWRNFTLRLESRHVTVMLSLPVWCKMMQTLHKRRSWRWDYPRQPLYQISRCMTIWWVEWEHCVIIFGSSVWWFWKYFQNVFIM